MAGAEDSDSDDGGNRFSIDETLIFFDFDDTVFPTEWFFHGQGLRLDSELSAEQSQELQELTRNAVQTLRIAKQLGTVIFVTAGEQGWIETGSEKFMPAVFEALEDVKLVSARHDYERPDRQSPFEWKLRAFETEIRRLYVDEIANKTRLNILSVGDGSYEREGVIHATAHLDNCCTKSLKFIDRPTAKQMANEHVAVAKVLRSIVHHDGNLDLCVSAK